MAAPEPHGWSRSLRVARPCQPDQMRENLALMPAGQRGTGEGAVR